MSGKVESAPTAPAAAPPTRAPARLSQLYTVQQAAALSGLGEHTLRYYERIGLITPVPRQESSGHRRYGPADLAKLETLACLRATGMPIDQMRRYLQLRGAGDAGAAEQQALLSDHLGELHRRMAALETYVQYVELKIDYWRAIENHDDQAAARIAHDAEALIHSTFMKRSS